MSDWSSPSDLRLVLLGNLGCGKTSSADTILGRLSPIDPGAARSCQVRGEVTEGRSVTLVEAPRWYWDGGKMDDSVREETARALTLVAPGPHAILLLVPVCQFTEMESRVPAELEQVFGEESLEHTLVLLTCGDYLMGRSVQEYLLTEHPGLQQIIDRCGGRYHVFNNRRRQDRGQVRELLEKVENMVQRKGVYHMKSAQDRELERRVDEKRRELMESYRTQKEERRESRGGENSATTWETVGRTDRDQTEGRVSEVEASNGLHSRSERDTYSSYSQDDRQVKRTPSFRLSQDGAVLCQMAEAASSPRITTTFHHRINSFEDRSPETSPSHHSPVFSSVTPPPTLAAPSPSSSSSSSFPYSPTLTSDPTAPSTLTSSYSSSKDHSPHLTSSSTFVSNSPASHSSSSSSYSSSKDPSSYLTSTSTYASSSPTTYSSSSSKDPSSYSTSTFASTSPTTYSSSSSSRDPSSYSTSTSTFASSSPTTYSSSSSSFSSFKEPSSYSTSTLTFSSSSPTSYSSSSSSKDPSSTSTSTSTFSSSSPTSYSSSSSSSKDPSSTSTSTSTFSSSSPTSSSFSSSSELRLVLLGRSGSGKSAAGNSILGGKEFKSDPDSLTSITQECEKKKAWVGGRRVAVVDTPDWFTSERTPDEVRAQISSCVALSSPGPHAFLLCVPLDQPAKTEQQALKALEVVFGPEVVQKHTLILFTHADLLRESGKTGGDGVESYIAAQRGDLLNIVEKCCDRFHVLESGGGGRAEQKNVTELLEKVEQTVKEAGGQCYSCPAFQEAENRVRQRQVEIAREKRGKQTEQERSRDVGQLSSERRVLYPYMQTVAEAEEEVREEEMEQTREEAEMSVSTMNIESLPPISLADLSPSLLRSIVEKMQSTAKMLPRLMSDGSVWVGDGAKKVAGSPVWGKVGSGAQNVQKMVADSKVWEKVGGGAKQASKMVGDRVPKVVADGAKAAAGSPVWGKVGSGAKLMADGSMRVGAGLGAGAKKVAQSPMWGSVGSGAKVVADQSMRLGSGIGSGAKTLAQSPMWGKVGSGAKSGAKLMADGSKKVAQSPVWGKVGSGAKEGAKMVAKSPVWGKIGTAAKKVPKVVIACALLGLLLGLVLGGALGGAIGAAAGSGAGEVGRRKLGNKTTLEKTNDAVKSAEGKVSDSLDSLVRQGEKALKTE